MLSGYETGMLYFPKVQHVSPPGPAVALCLKLNTNLMESNLMELMPLPSKLLAIIRGRK